MVDVVRGFEIQTYESIDILKARKTPFLIAANKIDLTPGWKSKPGSFLLSLPRQDPHVVRELEKRVYAMIGDLSRLGFRSDRFDRVRDFTKTVAIVPVSAKTGEGIPELLAVLIGLTQQYMKKRLLTTKGPARGVVLELKEEPGLGVTANVVIYDGVLRKGDTIVLSGKSDPIVTKVRALFLPKPLDEMRDPRERFMLVNQVLAAAGVKVVAPELEEALAGSPLHVVGPSESLDAIATSIAEEVERIRIESDRVGLVLKADTLGSLEALVNQLEMRGFSLRRADVGPVSRDDIFEASIVRRQDPFQGVVLAFNIRVLPDAEAEARFRGIRIFQSDVIYKLIEDYEEWVSKEREAKLKAELETLIKPAKLLFLPNCVFRRSKPAIIGVRVLEGTIEPGYPLMKSDGKIVGKIVQIQDKGQPIGQAAIGMEVAISMKEPVVGRQIREGDILYVSIPERIAKLMLTKYRSALRSDELEVLEEIVALMRKRRPLWAA